MAAERWSWALLIALLAALLVGAATTDRADWPSLVGDEATYLMQAESLAFDFDLFYERRDFERFVRHRGVVPEGLILQSGDGGQHITFGKPFFYAFYLAPFVRLAPRQGPFVANALLLALAALVAARVLERRLGAMAPLWVALLFFASVSFAHVFWVHADLFLACLVALALALVFGATLISSGKDTLTPQPPLPEGEGETRSSFSPLPRGEGPGVRVCFAVAGLLLMIVAYSRPMYATLFLSALAAAPAVGRRRAWPALLGGAVALLLVAALAHQSLSHSWTSYGASRRGFYSHTGFPGVDFPPTAWQDNLSAHGNHSWLGLGEMGRKKVDARLWAWNALYFTAGQNVGLLPYFPPVFLALAAFLAYRRRDAAGWALLAAVALSVGAFFWLRPFNFWGGGGALANRYFLPLYPAFFFLPVRLRPAWIAATALLAAPFLWPLWSAPRTFPLFDGEGTRYVSPAARALLPYETTQSHLKPAGRDDAQHGELWIKFLDGGGAALRGGERLRLLPRGGSFLVGSPRPLKELEIELRAPSTVHLEAHGGRLEAIHAAGSRQVLRLVLGAPRARHPMWWSWEPFYLYRLRLVPVGAEGPVAFVLSPAKPVAQPPAGD